MNHGRILLQPAPNITPFPQSVPPPGDTASGRTPWGRDPSSGRHWVLARYFGVQGGGKEHLQGSQPLPGPPITADTTVPRWHQTPDPPHPRRGPAMETVVIVAIGVLATIFLASFVALVVVCRQRYCHPKDLRHHYDTK